MIGLDPPAVALPPAFQRDEHWYVVLKDIVDRLNFGLLQGEGSPQGVVVADSGTLYRRLDGSPAFWVKESGDGTADGWSADDGVSFDIRTFGAVPGTDATVAIQAALDAVNAAGGGQVLIPGALFFVAPTTTIWLRVGSNTTVTGVGPASILRVIPNAGNYQTIFGAQTNATHVDRVAFRDFTIDQNPAANTTCDIQAGIAAQSLVAIKFFNFTSAAIDHVRFENCCGVNTVDLNGSTCVLAAVRNCYFKFVAGTTTTANGEYDNSAIYIDALEQIVTGNDFEAAIAAGNRARGCIEAHSGRATVFGNVSVGYETLCNVVTQATGTARPLTNIAVHGNVLTNGLHGVALWAISGYTLANVSVTDNILTINQADRAAVHSATASLSHSGVKFVNDSSGTLDGNFQNIRIAGNTCSFQSENRAGYSFADSGGVLLYARGSFQTVSVQGNTITTPPTQGIRLHSTLGDARGVVITDNTIVDSGNNTAATAGFRTAILQAGSIGYGGRIEDNTCIDTGVGAMIGVNGIIGPSGGGGVFLTQVRNNVFAAASFPTGAFSNTPSSFNHPQLTAQVTITGAAYQIICGEYDRYIFTLNAGSPAFTINASQAVTLYHHLRLNFMNTSGGAGPAITFGTVAWKTDVWVNPATGFHRILEIEWDGTTWQEVSRSGDIPN